MASGSNAKLLTVGLSASVVLASLAGLFTAITNVRKSTMNCTVHSLSMAYIVFFVITALALLGAGGAIFSFVSHSSGSEVDQTEATIGATAGVTILSLSTFALFAISSMLFYYAKNIEDVGLSKANYSVFGIFSILSVINTAVLLFQRKSIIRSEPFNQTFDYVQNRFGKGRSGGEESAFAGAPRVSASRA